MATTQQMRMLALYIRANGSWGVEAAQAIKQESLPEYRRACRKALDVVVAWHNHHHQSTPIRIETGQAAKIYAMAWRAKWGFRRGIPTPGQYDVALYEELSRLINDQLTAGEGEWFDHFKETGRTDFNPQAEPAQQESVMSDKEDRTAPMPAFESVDYVYGVDVRQATEAELIKAIRRAEAEIHELEQIRVESSKIAAMIVDKREQLKAIVDALDAR